MSSITNIAFAALTDIGRVRENNEDTYIAKLIWDDSHVLIAAIDGMGGEEGGEIAASIARDAIVKYLEDFHDDTPLNLIKRALADANNEIVRYKEAQPKYRRMGCVATAGIFDLEANTLSIAHVGDSRLYSYSNGELKKLTHDHSLVGYQEEQGIITEEQAMRHPRRSVIERCLGDENHYSDDKSFIEAAVFPLISESTFLFCSDGLSDVLSSSEIAECLEQDIPVEEKCKLLIDKANEAGGKDNITVALAKVWQETEETQDTQITEKAESPGEGMENDKKEPSHKWLWIILIALTSVLVLGIILYNIGTTEPKTVKAPTMPAPQQSLVEEDTVEPDTMPDSVLPTSIVEEVDSLQTTLNHEN